MNTETSDAALAPADAIAGDGNGGTAAEQPSAAMPAPHEAAASAAPIPGWPEIRHALLYPIPVEYPEGVSGKLAEIVIREPDLETLERVVEVIEAQGLTADDAKLGVKSLRPLLAAFTGHSPDLLKRLHYRDVTELSEKMAPLLEGLTS
jgi:hypothetical protein